jgi:hypothetical protein
MHAFALCTMPNQHLKLWGMLEKAPAYENQMKGKLGEIWKWGEPGTRVQNEQGPS